MTNFFRMLECMAFHEEDELAFLAMQKVPSHLLERKYGEILHTFLVEFDH